MSIQTENAVGGLRVGASSHWLRVWHLVSDRAVAPLFAALVLGYWEFHVRYFQVEALLLPPPSHIATAFWNGMASGLFLQHFAITIYRALSGFVTGVPSCCGDGVEIGWFGHPAGSGDA